MEQVKTKSTKGEIRDLERFTFTLVQRHLRFYVPEAPHLWKHVQVRSVLSDKIQTRMIEFRLGLISNKAPDPEPVKIYEPIGLFDFMRERYDWIRKIFGAPNMRERIVLRPFMLRMCPHHNIAFKNTREHRDFLKAKDLGLPHG